MTGPADAPAAAPGLPRLWRPIAFGTAAIVLVAAALWFVCSTTVSVLRTRAVLRDQMWLLSDRADGVESLGGPERAAGRLGFFLRVPGQDAAYRDAAVGLLSECGRSGVPVLIRLLRHRDLRVRAPALESLGRIGPEAAAAGPVLAEMLAGLDPVCGTAFHPAAAMALARTGPPEVAVPALERALGASDAEMRAAAVVGLGDIGPAARRAVPALLALAAEGGPGVRVAIAEALGRIGAEPARAVPVLTGLLGDHEPYVRGSAAGALGAFGSEAAAAVPALARTLGDEDKRTRWQAAGALGCIGPAASGAVPELTKMSKAQDRVTQLAALWALGRIEPGTGAAARGRTGLAGAWSGEYRYRDRRSGVCFNVLFLEEQGRLQGTLAEPNTFGDSSSRTLFATVDGTVDASGAVDLTKTYDGSGGQSHSVGYRGRLDAAEGCVRGTWTLSSSSGQFIMRRRGPGE